jgi:tetratricopeptide (TPR) repeat protein
MLDRVNYYALLGVPRGASDEDIRRRFRELARERHPDRFPPDAKLEAEAEFQALTEAYNVLTNPDRRAAHDFDLDNEVISETDPKAIAQAYLGKGIEAYRERRWDAALRNFEMAANHDGENAIVQHHYGMAAARFPNLLRQAVAALDKASRLEPHNPNILKDAGWVFRLAGLWTRAEKCYLEAMRWTPDSPDLRKGLEEARAHRVPSL